MILQNFYYHHASPFYHIPLPKKNTPTLVPPNKAKVFALVTFHLQAAVKNNHIVATGQCELNLVYIFDSISHILCL